jgi:hypothetical protein
MVLNSAAASRCKRKTGRCKTSAVYGGMKIAAVNVDGSSTIDTRCNLVTSIGPLAARQRREILHDAEPFRGMGRVTRHHPRRRVPDNLYLVERDCDVSPGGYRRPIRYLYLRPNYNFPNFKRHHRLGFDTPTRNTPQIFNLEHFQIESA